MLPKLRYEYWKAKEKNNKAVIAIVATLKGKRKYFSTGIEIDAKYWLGKELDKKMPNYAEIERIVRLKMQDIERGYLKDASYGKEISLNRVKKTDEDPKFSEVGTSCFNALKNKATETYIQRCLTYVNEFKLIIGDVRISEITAKMLQAYENYLVERGVAGNTINRRFKWLKQVANYCENHYGITIKAFKLHKHISYVQPNRTYLTIEQINKLKEIDLTNKPSLENTRNAFVIGCYTGLRFSDLQFINPKEAVIIDGDTKRIILTQKKTKDQVNIKINDEIYSLLNKLKPLATNVHTNRQLKELAAMIGVQELSFHISRHTFATTLLNKGGRIEVVSKLLGHKTIQTTQIYAKVANPLMDSTMDLLF